MTNTKKFRISPSIQICLGFVILILLGAFLLSLPISNKDGKWLNIVDALFTSTSSVCITGLTTVNIGSQFTLLGKIVMLLLIEIGALGTISLTSLILLILGKKINLSNRVALKESLNKDTVQGVVKFIIKIIVITLIIQAIGALMLLYSTITYYGNFWKGLFSAIFLSISAFCNSGVDPFDNTSLNSLGDFAGNVTMLIPIAILIIVGGIGFVVLTDGFKNFVNKQHSKVVLITTASLIIISTVLFLIFELSNPATIGNMSAGDKLLNAFFQSVTPRTAGFAVLDQSKLTGASRILTMLLMFIGGSPNSTAGGIKTTTLIILILFMFKKQNNNGDIVLNNKKVSSKILFKALKILIYVIFAILISVLAIRIAEPEIISTEAILFECISAISTVGLTMGITTTLSTFSQLILIVLMYAGRVGLTTIILAISSKSEPNNIEYNNTDIIVG